MLQDKHPIENWPRVSGVKCNITFLYIALGRILENLVIMQRIYEVKKAYLLSVIFQEVLSYNPGQNTSRQMYFPLPPLIQWWDLKKSGTWTVLSCLSNIVMGVGGGLKQLSELSGNFWPGLIVAFSVNQWKRQMN